MRSTVYSVTVYRARSAIYSPTGYSARSTVYINTVYRARSTAYSTTVYSARLTVYSGTVYSDGLLHVAPQFIRETLEGLLTSKLLTSNFQLLISNFMTIYF